jgi:hypothetical protein
VVGRVHGLAHLADPAGDAGRRLVVDDAHGLDVAAVSAVSRSCTTAGSTPWRQSPGTTSTSRPSERAMCSHRTAKCPVSKHSTLSPG